MSDVVLIVNPAAGKGAAAAAAARAALRLRERGIAVRVHQTTSAKDTTDAAHDAALHGARAVVACGGDGTINRVLQPLVGTDVPLGILPLGTGDDNARLLQIPRGQVELAADVVIAGATRTVDVALVRTEDGTERYFLGVLSTGFDSDVNEVANEMTRFSGTTKYIAAMLKRLRTFAPIPYEFTIDGVLHQQDAVLFSIGNGKSYGGGMKVTANAEPDDGELDAVWLDAVSLATLLRVFPMVYSGKHLARKEVHEARGRTFSVSAPGQVAYADGERIGELPITVRVVPSALHVLTPGR